MPHSDAIQDRGLPASPDAERTLLGAVLLNSEALDSISASLTPDAFYLESHRRIYCAMMDLVANGSSIDMQLLGERLGVLKQIESVGGMAYISSLTDGLPYRANISNHISLVRDKANLRRIIATCNKGISDAMEQNTASALVAAAVQEELFCLQNDTTDAGAKTAKEFMPQVLRELEEQASHDGLVGYTTGVPGLDSRTTGIRPGELWVVGALPGRGKTQAGLGIVSANMTTAVPSLIFELEMSSSQLGMRLLPQYSGIGATKIRDPKFISKSEWPHVARATSEIMQWPLYVDDASSLTTAEISARARLYIRRHKVKLIVVDYLMLVEEPSEKDARHKARKIANTFRRIAKDENVAVVLLSQLSRPKDGNENSRPSMISLRESGDIEAAAHTVLLLYMPKDDEGKHTGQDEIIIGKQRNGWLGTVKVEYDRSELRFKDRTEMEQ